MKDKKHIDRLFQEKFKDFEAQPSDAVWEKIALAKGSKPQRKVIPLWWKLGGIAAIGIALLAIGNLILPSSLNSNSPQLVEEQVDKKDASSPTPVIKQDAQKESLVSQDAKMNQDDASLEANSKNGALQTQNGSITSNTNTSGVSKLQKKSNTTTSYDRENYAYRSNASKNNTLNTQTVTTPSDIINSATALTNQQDADTDISNPADNTSQNDELIVEQEISKEDLTQVAQRIEEEKKKATDELDDDLLPQKETENTWTVGAQVAPVYYSDFGGSGIDAQFNDNAKTSALNTSYGVNVSYAVNDRLQIRTGVHNVDLSYTTNDIAFTPSIDATRLSSIDYDQNALFINITDAPNRSEAALLDSEFQSGGSALTQGAIVQNVGYLEIPIEASYKIVDKKIDLSVIGGMSTLFLNENSVALEANGRVTPVGDSNSLNDISFTTNLGLAVDYNITNHLKLNIAPTLKYQLNAYSGAASDFKPYYVGLYSGVSYRF